MAHEQTTEIGQFFDTYAAALSAIDVEAIAGQYHYPALAVTRLGCQAISTPEETKEFFAGNGQRYKDAGIETVRITDLSPSYDEDGLWVGLAVLENLDGSGEVVGREHNAYQLVRVDEGWRIAVTTPLDAR